MHIETVGTVVLPRERDEEKRSGFTRPDQDDDRRSRYSDTYVGSETGGVYAEHQSERAREEQNEGAQSVAAAEAQRVTAEDVLRAP